jgi:hypothetical protein
MIGAAGLINGPRRQQKCKLITPQPLKSDPQEGGQGLKLNSISKLWRAKTVIKPLLPHNFETAVELLSRPLPTIFISREAYSRTSHLINLAKDEIGWLGTVIRSGQVFLIDEVFLFKQHSSASDCVITEEGIAELAQQILETRPDGVEVLNRLRFWGHLHPGDFTSPSSQDEQEMTMFASNVEKTDQSWMIRGIFSRGGKAQFTLYFYDLGLRINDVSWQIADLVDPALEAEIKQELLEKVTPLVQAHLGQPSGVYVLRGSELVRVENDQSEEEDGAIVIKPNPNASTGFDPTVDQLYGSPVLPKSGRFMRGNNRRPLKRK